MNLSDLMAPDQGKVQPIKGSAQPNTEEDPDAEFATLVTEQSGEEAQTQSGLGAPTQGSASTDTPRARAATISTANAIGAPGIGVPVQDVTEITTATATPQVSDDTVAPTATPGLDGDGAVLVRTDGARPASGTSAVSEDVPTPRPSTPISAGTEHQSIPGDEGRTASLGQPQTASATAALPGEGRETVTSQTFTIENPVPASTNAPRDVPANAASITTDRDRAPLTATPSSAPGTSGASSAPDRLAPIAAQGTPIAAPARPAPRASLQDEGRTNPPSADDSKIDVKTSERTVARIADVPDLIDLPRGAPRTTAASAAQSPVVFGADAGFGPASGGGTTTQTTSTTPLDPRIGFSEPRAAAQHVAPQIVNALSARVPGTVIDVTLDPPELGRIEIMLDFAENGIRASLAAERQATGDLLKRHSDILSEHFEKAGFSDVDLSFGDPSGNTSGHSGTSELNGEALPPSGADVERAAAAPNRQTSAMAGGGIDILL